MVSRRSDSSPNGSFPVCKRPDCGRDAFARGLCHADYQVALKRVQSKSVTWADLEKAGLAVASRRRARAATTAWIDNVKPSGDPKP